MHVYIHTHSHMHGRHKSCPLTCISTSVHTYTSKTHTDIYTQATQTHSGVCVYVCTTYPIRHIGTYVCITTHTDPIQQYTQHAGSHAWTHNATSHRHLHGQPTNPPKNIFTHICIMPQRHTHPDTYKHTHINTHACAHTRTHTHMQAGLLDSQTPL